MGMWGRYVWEARGVIGEEPGRLVWCPGVPEGRNQALCLPRFIRAPKVSGELTRTCNGPSDSVKQCSSDW